MNKGVLLNIFATLLLTAISIWGSVIVSAADNFSKFQIWEHYISYPNFFMPQVIIFSLLCVLFIVIFYLMLSTNEKKIKDAQAELLLQSQKLEETIRTLPPEAFLNLFSEKYGEAHAVYKTLLMAEGNFTKQEIELSIRGILLGVLRLTAFFDRANEDHHYGANIMIFTEAYKNDEKFKPELKDNLRFANDDADLKLLKGILYLKHELSTNTFDGDSSVDEKIKSISLALPVPFEAVSTTTQKFKALPGAPLAITLNSPNVYANTGTLDEWVRTQGDFNKTIETQIKEYFCDGEGKEIKSFCSIPLSCDGKNPIAVLNIHKNEVDMLSQKGQFAMYINIMYPFLSIASELVSKLTELRNKKP